MISRQHKVLCLPTLRREAIVQCVPVSSIRQISSQSMIHILAMSQLVMRLNSKLTMTYVYVQNVFEFELFDAKRLWIDHELNALINIIVYKDYAVVGCICRALIASIVRLISLSSSFTSLLLLSSPSLSTGSNSNFFAT